MGKVSKLTVEKISKASISGGSKQKINLKDKFNDGEMDLSMCDLQEVPVKDLITYTKMYSLDLSDNHITLLPSNFVSLSNIIKLDLSKNSIRELPENFGELTKLKHLDLYRNQLQHLPLGFSKLSALKWLDLKDNPLVPRIAEVAGPCLDAKQCQTCAKNVVQFFIKLEKQIEQERQMRQKHREQSMLANNLAAEKQKKQPKKRKGNPVKSEELKDSIEELGVISNNQKKAQIKPKKDIKIVKKKSLFATLLKLLFFLIILLFITLFLYSSIDNLYAQDVKDFVGKHWETCISLLPENVSPTAITYGKYVSDVHSYVGSKLLEIVEAIKHKDK